jgi:prepilin-type N-terminal cleavage/methylation domain-containing protein
MRTGFTLIEVIVALVLFQIGMLAFTGISAVAARDLATTRLRARAHALARNRVEMLRASACAMPVAAGAQTARGLTEFWRVDANGSRRSITDSIDFRLPRGRRAHIVAHAFALCAP